MSRGRLIFVAVCCALAVSGLLARAAYVCVVSADVFGPQALKQALTDLQIHGQRGDIVDRHGQQLAWSVPVKSAYARRQFVQQPFQTAQRVAEILKTDANSVFTQLSGERGYVWLRRWLSQEEEAAFEKLREPGVALTDEARRYYTQRETAAHILGFVDHDEKGLEGIERAFDQELRGKPLTVSALRDTRGRTFVKGGALPAHTAAAGHTVVLTIDAALQYETETALENAAVAAKAKGASAIVIEPQSGEILALASYPRFNPNSRGVEPADARRARPVTDMFEPGSTMKPFTIATAIEHGVVAPTTKMFCHLGQRVFGSGKWQRTIKDVKALGEATVAEVVKYSSNICTALIGEKVNKTRLREGFARFFFGERTEVGLPGESKGALHPLEKWSGSSVVTHSYGYGLAVTAVQLAQGYAALANDGEVVRPRLVREVRNAQGLVVKRFERERRGIAVSPQTARKVREMMVGVTEKGGTGRRAAIPGFRIAAKTGTALKPGKPGMGYTGSKRRVVFAGIFPADEPKLVAIVMFEEPEGKVTGGQIAAPAWKDIVERAIRHLGITPDPKLLAADLAGQKPGGRQTADQPNAHERGSAAPLLANVREAAAPEPRDEGPKTGVPELRGLGMKSALVAASERGLTLEIEGSGRAVRQDPAPGARLAPGGSVKVVFEPEDG